MTNFQRLSLAATACALLFGVAPLASAQDLSRYRDIAFGSSVATVVAATGVTAADVKVIHQRPALIRRRCGCLRPCRTGSECRAQQDEGESR